jgi:riboflavin synthase
VVQVEEAGGALRARIDAPAELARFVARKGSVALDGVSLTVGEVEGARFVIDVVPHTRTMTTLGALAAGQPLNLEIDLFARYLDRLLSARDPR